MKGPSGGGGGASFPKSFRRKPCFAETCTIVWGYENRKGNLKVVHVDVRANLANILT